MIVPGRTFTGEGPMAKKKSEVEPVVASTETDLKPVRVELTPELHRLLRKVAADEGVSMAAFARLTMERVIREEAKKRGVK
jgi:hypothetical protein